MKIVFGAAKGLAFLHEAQKLVIYRDFKASNVSIDSDYAAKLSDFGLAKDGPEGDDTHVSTRVMGTRVMGTRQKNKIKFKISNSCTTLMVEDGGEREGSQRRQLFEGIEFKEEEYSGFESVCVPPKNALLLMRCRSDPVKVVALAKRLLETFATVIKEEKKEDEEVNIHKISPEEIFKQEQEIKGDEDEKDEYPKKEDAVENGEKGLEIENQLRQSNNEWIMR